ncbi:Membrane-associated phospholipid phosphatase [Corynebacterium pseudotuberculosis]|uniref:phosphatase PAP2 family protein n=1 Tax=Corynebacterium pseudotuberculosis TaxID=1719 RepID=UPI00065DE764|nr:phosphatase PAP2 family protein [Corynebacterium pseudotuberculosis]AKP09554.1 Membrane-associated phospholipid phosphatase [Corynebacterium pseudotuberculosis]
MSKLESDVLVGIQSCLASQRAVLPTARALSHFGEHALGWMGLAALGACADKGRRRQWIHVGVSAFLSHAASVVIKRIVRRKRPHDERITIGVGTPSKLSFPSSHATSTSAALVSLAKLTRSPLPLLGIPVMMTSRMVLGVHYPTDVAVGAILGAATAQAVSRMDKKEK